MEILTPEEIALLPSFADAWVFPEKRTRSELLNLVKAVANAQLLKDQKHEKQAVLNLNKKACDISSKLFEIQAGMYTIDSLLEKSSANVQKSITNAVAAERAKMIAEIEALNLIDAELCTIYPNCIGEVEFVYPDRTDMSTHKVSQTCGKWYTCKWRKWQQLKQGGQ
jgi:hypothetical protein